jgi:hypothetical protein
MPILSAIGSPSAAGATAPSICCLTSVSVAPSIAVAPDPPLEVGSFVPGSVITECGAQEQLGVCLLANAEQRSATLATDRTTTLHRMPYE